MKLSEKIKNLFSRYLLDNTFRSKVHLIPEIILVIIGLCSSNYSLIFYGCLVLVAYNMILNFIAKKIAIKKISQEMSKVSNQVIDNDIEIN